MPALTRNPDRLKQALADQLALDSQKPSRTTPQPDGTVLVRPSGRAAGLAITIEHCTGEDYDDIIQAGLDTLGTIEVGPTPAPQAQPWSITFRGTITFQPE